MAKIIEIQTLKLRKCFELVKVEMDAIDVYGEVDYNSIELNPRYAHFRYLTGVLRLCDKHYFTFYLCSLDPHKRVSDKDMELVKDIIKFSQL